MIFVFLYFNFMLREGEGEGERAKTLKLGERQSPGSYKLDRRNENIEHFYQNSTTPIDVFYKK